MTTTSGLEVQADEFLWEREAFEELYRHKPDANAKEIVHHLRRVGATVVIIRAAALGFKGLPDLLVGFHGTTYLMELKNKDGRGKESPEQKLFRLTWTGGPVVTVWTVPEALAAIGLRWEMPE